MHLRTHLFLFICTVGLNNNPFLGQFVDALKTAIINGLAYRVGHDSWGWWCLSSGQSAFLSQVQCFFTQSVDKSWQGNHWWCSIHCSHEWTQEGVCTAIRAGDVKMLSVAYISRFIARCLLCNDRCDACKACLISEALSPADVYVIFRYIILPIQLRCW